MRGRSDFLVSDLERFARQNIFECYIIWMRKHVHIYTIDFPRRISRFGFEKRAMGLAREKPTIDRRYVVEIRIKALFSG